MDCRRRIEIYHTRIPVEGKKSSIVLGKYQSGQMGQTVNLLAYAFGGSNPSLPTKIAEVAQLIEH